MKSNKDGLILFGLATIIALSVGTIMGLKRCDDQARDPESQTREIQNWDRVVELTDVPPGVRCFEVVGSNGNYVYHPFSCVLKQKE